MNANPAYVESWVAEVTVARANGAAIRSYQSKAWLLEKERTYRAFVKKYSCVMREICALFTLVVVKDDALLPTLPVLFLEIHMLTSRNISVRVCNYPRLSQTEPL